MWGGNWLWSEINFHSNQRYIAEYKNKIKLIMIIVISIAPDAFIKDFCF